MVVDIAEKTARIAVGKAIIGTDNQGTAVPYLFYLREIAVRFNMYVIERIGIQPLPGGIRDAGKPANKVEWQQRLAATALSEFRDEAFSFSET